MMPAQTLSWTTAQAASRLRTYRVLLTVALLVDVAVGIWCMLDPIGFARTLHQADPYPRAWLQLWGATWFAIQLVYVPGWKNPLFYRWHNWANIAVRYFVGFGFLFCKDGFVILAVWQIGFALALSFTYYRLLAADVARRP